MLLTTLPLSDAVMEMERFSGIKTLVREQFAWKLYREWCQLSNIPGSVVVVVVVEQMHLSILHDISLHCMFVFYTTSIYAGTTPCLHFQNDTAVYMWRHHRGCAFSM